MLQTHRNSTRLRQRRRIAELPGVAALVFGSIDFQLEPRHTGDREELLFFRSAWSSYEVAGLQPRVDGVTVDNRRFAQVRDDTLYAKRLGFGAQALHPSPTDRAGQRMLSSERGRSGVGNASSMRQRRERRRGQVAARWWIRPVLLKAQEILREPRRR